MREKSGNSAWFLGPNPIVHSWFKILTMCVFLGILIVWGIDGLNVSSFHNDFVVLKLDTRQTLPFKDFNFRNLSAQHKMENHEQIDLNLSNQILAKTHENVDLVGNETRNVSLLSPGVSANSSKNLNEVNTSSPRIMSWISSVLEANYSSNLLAKWLTPGGEPCKDSRSMDIRVDSLDGNNNNNNNVELLAGEMHEFVFQAVDEAGEPHCLGGDYFETDLSGEKWKSRPPVKDLGNGTYAFSLQVHPDFAGDYNLTIILLFRHYEGLKFSPSRFALDRVLRVIPIKFVRSSSSQLPEIRQCRRIDYTRDVWSGRWTRHARNISCPISHDGRYRCQKPSFPCQQPWCDGPLGVLESNGWVYSAHCSFKLYSSQEAWSCLNKRWIFWWGDSNHCDTIRNILHFILDVPDIPSVPRLFDMNITNPRNASQTVRFTSIFNGHWNHTGNYQGLNSLINENYRDMLKAYFSQDVVPDTVIMNSGLHDGIYWSTIRNFIKGADYAASFWAEVVEGVRRRGLRPPEIIYRTTVATGGYARSMAFNPHKMEAFNGVVLDKLRQYGLLGRVIDDFDMTYPWHFDNRCNDGVHYGRAPLKAKWRDGQIGHQYFVDLMLGHVLINALCVRSV
ncbi:cytochrome P450 family protein [Perilla frutescens var. frutescens]|nr:cytochrome P450 family protein [Perilla frutescens var. frutescens]